MRRIVARWQDWAGETSEHLCLTISTGGIIAESTFISSRTDGYAARYRIALDQRWRTHRVDVEIVGTGARRVLQGDGQGHWADDDGNGLPILDGAIDPDLAITPFTNTLPIRRLGERPAGSTDIFTAWMAFPDLTVQRDPQRYTCLEPKRRWLYESRDSDFRRQLEIDDDGLVTTYPGLFRRVL